MTQEKRFKHIARPEIGSRYLCGSGVRRRDESVDMSKPTCQRCASIFEKKTGRRVSELQEDSVLWVRTFTYIEMPYSDSWGKEA